MASEREATAVFQRISASVAVQPVAVAQTVQATLLCLGGLPFFSKCNTARYQKDEDLLTSRKHFVDEIEQILEKLNFLNPHVIMDMLLAMY